MRLKVTRSETEPALRQRGVEVVAVEERHALLRCRACGAEWRVERASIEPPSEANRYWWCPNGCNREE